MKWQLQASGCLWRPVPFASVNLYPLLLVVLGEESRAEAGAEAGAWTITVYAVILTVIMWEERES